jgi:hypothetical protein
VSSEPAAGQFETLVYHARTQLPALKANVAVDVSSLRESAGPWCSSLAEPDIHQSVIDYIAAFMRGRSGKNFSPHVTIGVGTTAFLDAMR